MQRNRKENMMTDVSISNLVAEHVTLKRTPSTSKFLGCCPFHEERTPSFIVDENAGLFCCLSCRAKGDTQTFRRMIMARGDT
jgi:DNA primase